MIHKLVMMAVYIDKLYGKYSYFDLLIQMADSPIRGLYERCDANMNIHVITCRIGSNYFNYYCSTIAELIA